MRNPAGGGVTLNWDLYGSGRRRSKKSTGSCKCISASMTLKLAFISSSRPESDLDVLYIIRPGRKSDDSLAEDAFRFCRGRRRNDRSAGLEPGARHEVHARLHPPRTARALVRRS